MPAVSESTQTNNARDVPAASDILCEGCGYRLNGLPTDSRCPECGKPIAESVAAGRFPTAWDRAATPSAFLATSAVAIFRPAHFYRTLATRARLRTARSFAMIYWALTSTLFAVAATVHLRWYFNLLATDSTQFLLQGTALLTALGFFAITYMTLLITTRFAARLTTWEATYRGYRLPINVVLRGMYYHAAHYLPVALIACGTVVGFIAAIDHGLIGAQHLTTYLYVLSAEVVIGAGYLFSTYWIGMRNMMYANE